MGEVFTQTTIPGWIHRRRRRAGRRTPVRRRRRVWAGADGAITFDVDEAIRAPESKASIVLTSTADPSVIARSWVVAAMRRVLASAPRPVDHQAVRSGSASGPSRRRAAQVSGTARSGRVRRWDRLRRRARTLVRHERPIRGCV